MNTYEGGRTFKRLIAFMVASMAVLTLFTVAILILTLSGNAMASNGSASQGKGLSHFGAISTSPSAEQGDAALFATFVLAGPLIDPSIDAPIVNSSVVDASVDSSGCGSLINSSLGRSSTQGPISLPDATAPSEIQLTGSFSLPSSDSPLKGPLA